MRRLDRVKDFFFTTDLTGSIPCTTSLDARCVKDWRAWTLDPDNAWNIRFDAINKINVQRFAIANTI